MVASVAAPATLPTPQTAAQAAQPRVLLHTYSVPQPPTGGLQLHAAVTIPPQPVQRPVQPVARQACRTAPSGYGLTATAVFVPRDPVAQLPSPADGWTLIRHATSRVMGSVAAALPRTFRCPFCLENVREEERIVLFDCGTEDHGVCRECMGHYIRGLVVDGRVNRIGCHLCGGQATPEEVLDLTDEATHTKFMRFREMRQDPTVRECPSCSSLCRPTVDDSGSVVAEMTCGDCGTRFCYYHSNAHVGRPCHEYRREIARQERLNERGAMHGTKACPECGIMTEKTGGCNHMTCQRCGADWCWTCGMRLEDGQAAVYEHYHGGGPAGCRQFEDFDPRSPLAHLLRCLAAPVRLLSVVLFLLLGLTMLVWFPVAFICLVPCHRCSLRSECMECVLLCAVNLAFLPFVAFQLCWILCSGVLWLLLKPCGAECGHLVFLMQVPFVSVLPLIAGALRVRGRRGGRGQAWQEWELQDQRGRRVPLDQIDSSDEEDDPESD